MPSDMSNIPAGLEKSITGRLDKVTKAMETDKSDELAALKTRLEQQAKMAARVREQMAKDAIDDRSKTRITDRVSQQKAVRDRGSDVAGQDSQVHDHHGVGRLQQVAPCRAAGGGAGEGSRHIGAGAGGHDLRHAEQAASNPDG
jgi:hypothetical protein